MTSSEQNGFIGKRSSLLQRRQDLSVPDFRDHWAGPHAVIACAMPGLALYTQNRSQECLWSSEATKPAYACDGIVELEFRDQQSMLLANQGDAVQKLLPEDEPRFLSGITLCQVPVGARQTWPGKVKAMLVAQLEGDTVSVIDELKGMLASTGCVESSIDLVSNTFHRPTLEHEADPPHLFATMWFDPQCDLQKAFAKGSSWDLNAAAHIRRGAVWLCDPLVIIG